MPTASAAMVLGRRETNTVVSVASSPTPPLAMAENSVEYASTGLRICVDPMQRHRVNDTNSRTAATISTNLSLCLFLVLCERLSPYR